MRRNIESLIRESWPEFTESGLVYVRSHQKAQGSSETLTETVRPVPLPTIPLDLTDHSPRDGGKQGSEAARKPHTIKHTRLKYRGNDCVCLRTAGFVWDVFPAALFFTSQQILSNAGRTLMRCKELRKYRRPRLSLAKGAKKRTWRHVTQTQPAFTSSITDIKNHQPKSC